MEGKRREVRHFADIIGVICTSHKKGEEKQRKLNIIKT